MSPIDTAFVLGGADTLYADLERAAALVTPDTYVATNHAGRDWPGELPHWVTHHTENMPGWIDERRDAGRPDALQFWTSNTKTIPPEHATLYHHVPAWDGSSGLLAVTVALHLGYQRVILCGVPLDIHFAHYDDEALWQEASHYRGAWNDHMHEMLGKVKSFNGWTALKLGEPTQEWINGD